MIKRYENMRISSISNKSSIVIEDEGLVNLEENQTGELPHVYHTYILKKLCE